MRYALLIGGLLALAGLWGLAAARIAPAMEVEVQRQGARLVAALDFPLQTRADGLVLLVTGEIVDRTDRFTIRDRLRYLHPLVNARLDLTVKADASANKIKATGSSIRRWRRPPKSDDTNEAEGEASMESNEGSNCELLRRMDPSLVCEE